MNVATFALGALVLAFVVTDILWTTLWVEGGAGPLTSRLMARIWNAFRRLGSPDSRLLTLAGPVILVFGIGIWTLLLWSGWALLFAAGDGAIVDTVGSRRVSWSEVLYFTGYTVFTLGIGDYIPRTAPWQIATVFASASGLLFITLIVTYVLSVLGAVTQKRSFANGVSGLGTGSTTILKTSWAGESFRGLDVPLDTISTQLNTLTSNHKAYPILHYFYSERSEQAPTTSVVILDEALTLLRCGVPERNRPSELIIAEATSSVQRYLDTLDSAYIDPADHTPPPPDIEDLRRAGIPTVTDEEFDTAVEALAERRRTLLGLVESDARRWPSDDG